MCYHPHLCTYPYPFHFSPDLLQRLFILIHIFSLPLPPACCARFLFLSLVPNINSFHLSFAYHFLPPPNIPFPETFLNILSSLYFLISTCPSLSNHFHYYFKELKFLLSFKSKSKSSVSLHILLASST